jgi:iron-sulfur cluster insertion protein
MNFSLSSQAADRIRALQTQNTGSFLRIRVDPGGCAGFQYTFVIDTQKTPDDLCFEREGAYVVIDDLSLTFLEGAELDYHQDMMGASFVLKNPNAASSCGCKSSFTPK